MKTPIYQAMVSNRPFKALPTEYTQQFTPEVARQAGDTYGRQQHNQAILSMLRTIKRPSKQLTEIINHLEALEWHS